MVLEKLGKSLKSTLQKLAKSGLVDKKQIQELANDIKKSLISSDTNIQLANQIADSIVKRATTEKPAAGLTTREHTVNIVYEELVELLGKGQAELDLSKIIHGRKLIAGEEKKALARMLGAEVSELFSAKQGK